MSHGTSDPRAPIVVLTPRNTRCERVERVPAYVEYDDVPTPPQVQSGEWRVWIAANKDFTLGTYLALYDDGKVERVTLRDDSQGPDIMLVKDKDDYDATG